MTLALIIYILVSALEIIIWTPKLWQFRRQLTVALIVATICSIGWLSIVHLTPWTVLLGILCIYRIVNLKRVYAGRTHPDYLFHEARRASWILFWLQALVLSVAAASSLVHLGVLFWWYILVALQLITALVLVVTARRSLRTTRPPTISQDGIADRDLPSLTVCIPARNETDDLEACLTTLIASTYAKLEIIVLDDCSQNRHTPEIIRGFAHDGVRFISGTIPPQHWLAKNYAYAQLAKEANGELLMFCGVDTRFEKQSLNTIVRTLLLKKKSMLTIVPQNILPARRSYASSIAQTGRYCWELALPRRLLERPPVLSTCWLIRRELLQTYGGFEACKQSVLPERHLARRATSIADGYSMLCSSAAMGVTSQKDYTEQLATAIRTRYPQLHRRPELVAVLSVIEFATLVWPFILLVVASILGSWLLVCISLATCMLLVTFYSQMMGVTYRSFLGRSLWLLPFAALCDIWLLNYSMQQYEFDEVIWKGRNVCVPVMRVYQALPSID